MEQSATPWRVFDAPSSADGAAGGAPPQPPAAPASRFGAPANRLAIAGVGGALLVGAIAVVVALSGSGGQIVDAPAASEHPSGPGNGAALLAGGDIVVDVTGAVTKPGVYHLPAGSRVGDAIDAAGGFSPRVDADNVGATLNLAATVTDGSQIHVPSRDDAAASGGGNGGGGNGGGAGGGDAGTLVDLNAATESELDALPGIGPVTAKKIIDSRTAQPFTAIDDLRTRKLMGEKTFDQLKSLVTVG